MKRVIFMLVLFICFCTQLSMAENNPVPEYQFLTYPTTIMTSYYDYLPGGLNTYPIAHQTEFGEGIFLTFFGREDITSNRRQYYTYLNADGSINDYGTISLYDEWQGYGDIEVHPATGDGIATWHELIPQSRCVIALNDFYNFQLPLLEWGYGYFYSTSPDEYLRPQIHKGPSPLGDDWIRYYHVSYNFSPDPYGHPCEDIRILYIDVENTTAVDLNEMLVQANWTEVCPLYDWRDVSCQPSASFAVDYINPGHVAIIGIAHWLEGDLGNMPVQEGAFVWESWDYGATWDDSNLHDDGPGTAFYDIDNLPQFKLPNGNIPDKLYTRAGGYHSTAIIDNEGCVHFPYLQEYTVEDSQYYYYSLTEFHPQAEFIWDGNDFIFRNVPAFPWMDTGGSGHDVPWGINPVSGDTLYQYRQGLYFCDEPYALGSVQSQSFSVDDQWMIQVWADCTYHYFALNGYPGYSEYLNHPLIALSASNDNGETWSEILYLTDINNPNFNFTDQITVYPFTQKIIQDVDGSHGKFVIVYMDDNDFGSYIEGYGPNTGGQIIECIVQMDFSLYDTGDEPEVVVNSQNYPNPFKLSTKIYFSSNKRFEHHDLVCIYNTKGQLVRTLDLTLESPHRGYSEWNGKDSSGRRVANGIYFYRLSGSKTSSGKMLLTR